MCLYEEWSLHGPISHDPPTRSSYFCMMQLVVDYMRFDPAICAYGNESQMLDIFETQTKGNFCCNEMNHLNSFDSQFNFSEVLQFPISGFLS